jgi:uncharacterized protein (DUF3820 family)
MAEKPIIMTGGKFRGKPIDEIPSDYLLWVAQNWDENSDENKKLVEACDKEYQFRETYNCHF